MIIACVLHNSEGTSESYCGILQLMIYVAGRDFSSHLGKSGYFMIYLYYRCLSYLNVLLHGELEPWTSPLSSNIKLACKKNEKDTKVRVMCSFKDMHVGSEPKKM